MATGQRWPGRSRRAWRASLKKRKPGITNILYELLAFVLADGIGANLERADMLSNAGHGLLLVIVAMACASSIGLRTRKDESAFWRGISSVLFGALAAAYTFGLGLMGREAVEAVVFLVIICAIGGAAAFAVSTVASKAGRRNERN